jgi:NADH-quinone oxidoreductase subunit K
MSAIPVEQGLAVAGLLFALGAAGVLIRRNVMFILLSLEIMINAAGLAFVIAGAQWHEPDGQVLFIFILTVAAVEVAVGLALILWLYHWNGTLDADRANRMRG